MKSHHRQYYYVFILLFHVFVTVRGGPVILNKKDDKDSGESIRMSTLPSADTFAFMKRYGYLDPGISNSEALYSEAAVVIAIKNVQKYGAIPETGIIDNATIALMKSPRCGVPDIFKQKSSRRKKRFVIGASGWQKRDITYFVANWSPKIGEQEVVQEIQRALDVWGGYGRLTFKPVRDPSADIIVAFGSGPHGDPFPFDGPGSILAHAFYPYEMNAYGGDIHFDADENWTVRPQEGDEGIDFFTVAVHELGHSLGLAHSNIPSSIMFPYYRGYDPGFQLDYDDILAMYELYIQRNLPSDHVHPPKTNDDDYDENIDDHNTSENPTDDDYLDTNIPSRPNYPSSEDGSLDITTPRVTTPRIERFTTMPSVGVTFYGDDETVDEHIRHDKTHNIPTLQPDIPTSTVTDTICDGNFDAVASLRGELFIFKDEFIWRLGQRGIIMSGYPVELHQIFYKLPKTIMKIDAAYEREDGHIILFTGKQYWVFNGDDFIENSPRPLTDYGLPSYLGEIDAAQVWNKNKKTYLYSRDRFWRYNETTKQMDPGYPQTMKRWRGVPSDLDAALTWTDGYTYFFKGTLFWKFDNYFIKTEDRYPLPAPQIWLGCPEKPDTMWWLPP